MPAVESSLAIHVTPKRPLATELSLYTAGGCPQANWLLWGTGARDLGLGKTLPFSNSWGRNFWEVFGLIRLSDNELRRFHKRFPVGVREVEGIKWLFVVCDWFGLSVASRRGGNRAAGAWIWPNV